MKQEGFLVPMSLVDAVSAHARTQPQKIAVNDGEVALDYRALDALGARFADRLRAAGVQRGDRVAMVALRQAVLMPAILGVFRMRAIHVPVDPAMPDSRLQYIVNDVAPAAAFVAREHEARMRALLPHAPIFVVEDLAREAITTPAADSGPSARSHAPAASASEDTAYCIYTSGSTGRPKGVLISHRSVECFFEATPAVYDVSASSRCASFSPMHFDVFLMDMLFPLYQGATLHLLVGMVSPDPAFALLERESITHFSAWGLMLGLIAQAERFGRPLPLLETILTGTDVPEVKAVRSWLQCSDRAKVINAYGPTEVTCAATAFVITRQDAEHLQSFPIGRPLPGVSTLLLDESGEAISQPGVPGELLLGGPQVMQGYRNLDAETAARLLEIDGHTYYRTGDVCELLDDAGYRFIGRRDNEISLGGYRVHLNEVERVINSVDHVHASAVVVAASGIGERILVAAVLPSKSRAPTTEALSAAIRKRLREELPRYMVPRKVLVMDEFPRLSSGKTDRKRLSEILEGQLAMKRRIVA